MFEELEDLYDGIYLLGWELKSFLLREVSLSCNNLFGIWH